MASSRLRLDHAKRVFNFGSDRLIVLLQQVPERQDRGLIRDPVTDQFDASESAHRRHLDQCILHGWIAEVIPLLQQMNPQHGFQRIRRATTLARRLGVVGLDQVDQRLPWHNDLHLREETLASGALFCRGLLVITEAKLLASHQPSPYLQSQAYFRAGGLGFPVSP